jgi:diacylglycerol kinase (ATP)
MDENPMTTDHRPPTTERKRQSSGVHRPLSVVGGRSSEDIPGRAASRAASFGYAFRGIGYLLATQRNAQIHCALAALALGLGAAFGIERAEWATLILTIALVLAAEGVNTAVEATVDLASPDYHPLARTAKDVAAGTVLLAAVAAVAVGAVIFLPRLWPVVASLL